MGESYGPGYRANNSKPRASADGPRSREAARRDAVGRAPRLLTAVNSPLSGRKIGGSRKPVAQAPTLDLVAHDVPRPAQVGAGRPFGQKEEGLRYAARLRERHRDLQRRADVVADRAGLRGLPREDPLLRAVAGNAAGGREDADAVHPDRQHRGGGTLEQLLALGELGDVTQRLERHGHPRALAAEAVDVVAGRELQVVDALDAGLALARARVAVREGQLDPGLAVAACDRQCERGGRKHGDGGDLRHGPNLTDTSSERVRK